MANRTVSVALMADVGQYQSAMVRAASSTKAVGTSATTAGSQARRGFEAAGQGARLLQVALAGGVALGLKSVVDAASEAEQSIGGAQAVFKDYADTVINSSEEADRALGLSANSYRELATIIGSQMKNAGVPLRELAGQTEDIIGIGADLAAQFGGSTQSAVEALSSAFRGELDPIERYGISLTAAAVGAKAVEMGLAESATELSQNAKAMATLAIITEQSADAQGAFSREADTAAGRAQRAAAQWENLKVAVGDRLLPVWSALVDTLGTEVIPALGELLDTGGDVVRFIADHKEIALTLAAILGVQLAGGITAVTVAFNRMVLTPVVLGLTSVLGVALNLPGAFLAARTAVAGFLTAAAPLAAVGAIVYAVSKTIDFATAAGDARKEVAGMWAAVDDARGLSQMDALEGVVDQIRAKVGELRENLSDDGVWESTILGGLITGAISDTKALEEYERQLRIAQKAEEDAVNTARILGNQFGLNRDQVLELAEKYDIDLTQGTQNAYLQFQRFYTTEYGDGPMNSTHQLREAMETLADVTSTAEEKIKALKDALDILGGKQVSVFEATSALQQVVQSATGAMEGLSGEVLTADGHLNAYTESGQRAGDVLVSIRDKGNDLITTMVEQGSTLDEVRAADAELRRSFIESARQMGISQEAANALADEILGVPEERETRFTAATDQASAKIAALQAQINAVAQNRTATINFRATLPDLNGSVSGSGRPGLAYGGPVPGFSAHDRADNVPINATAGEFMQPRPSVRKYGLDFMEDVRTGRFPVELARNYADGGLITLEGAADTANASAGIAKVNDGFLTSANAAARKIMEPGIGLVAALNFARSQIGKPYVWGAAGPGGYDCSGFMSALTNVARGKTPYSRLGSTATFPWPGFAAGNGLFTIGSTSNAGGGIGHMAGTLFGINVESAGGVGVRVGAGARGASDRLFGTRAHLAMYTGGVIGEPVVGAGLWSGRSYSFAERGDEVVLPRGREYAGGSGSGSSAAVTVPAPQVTVRFYVDGQEFRGIARVEVESAMDGLTAGLSAAGVRG